MLDAFRKVRAQTVALTAPLEAEDQVVQSMPDVSPTKWHLAHTSWFFETFLLEPFEEEHRPYHPRYRVLFNSYYNTVGAQFPREERGRLSRPTVAEVMAYRRAVDERMSALIEQRGDDQELRRRVNIGLHHEQQHQELILTDLKHVLARNPLDPVYRETAGLPAGRAGSGSRGFVAQEGGRLTIGHAGDGFGFDNEYPRHEVLVRPFEIAEGLVTEGEWLEFMKDGGYQRCELWLSDGWAVVQQRGWRAPLYWQEAAEGWTVMTLSGRRPIDSDAVVCHVSMYEADAFARWRRVRLPTEVEWEVTAGLHAKTTPGTMLEDQLFHPVGAVGSGLRHLFGEVWSWTGSAYLAYPGYRALPGALGEYNGKFMSGQVVLRGGSCATPADHIRASYRNFFPPDKRWQFSGVRLARDVESP